MDNSESTASGNTSTTKARKALLDRFITLSGAQAEEEDMTVELQYAVKRAKFYNEFADCHQEIQQLIAFHCGLTNPSLVQVPEMFGKDGELVWQHGSFNMCIPVCINRAGRNNAGNSLPSKLGFRVPLPYKLGEEAFPGNVEEKVRSEAATYIWINENCPDIPIPKLRGFGVTGGLSFCEPGVVSLWERIKFCIWSFARCWCWTGESSDSKYVPRKRKVFLDQSYILMDWIEDVNVQMLSNVFSNLQTDMQTENLYRSLSRIMISLARIPQRRIGSWTINNDGQISLTNRPMFYHLHQLENWSIPTDIPRNITYTSADSLYLDLLTSHDNRLQYQKNAVFDEIDARSQAKDLLLMRALLPQFTYRHLRSGPFVMQFTDMHASNVFVDENWNIKHVIDLEWTCSLPLGNLRPPFWLTGKGVDEIEDAEYERFKTCYNQFVDIFEQVEASTNTPLCHDGNLYSRGTLMKTALDDCQYWYLSALHTPKGLFNLFRMHLEPMFDKAPKAVIREGVSPFWKPGMTSFVNSKVDEHTRYLEEVRDIINGIHSH
ncbi:hypothetical protein EMCG_01839 [[Emmonsia] crescens]|uniref:Aminoglycoside phosphotransferase domain-containing protein n=1 Tax=[Emmonsia] crescens TaxID=73230 RepID=A0A0G2J9F4_9EURO|nr:hypothetical protein EMCG_01839 [Emmonsia crescens UAMH 3008]